MDAERVLSVLARTGYADLALGWREPIASPVRAGVTLSASGPGNVWIFGQEGRAWRWNGLRWRVTGWPYPYRSGAGRRRWQVGAIAVSTDEAWVSGWDEEMVADG